MSAGISDTSSATTFPTEIPFTAILAILVVVLVVVVLVVVVVLRFPRNDATILAGVVLTNNSILRLTGVHVVPTRAPETRTGRRARSTTAVGEQSPSEEHARRIMLELLPVREPWNALLSVGQIFQSEV